MRHSPLRLAVLAVLVAALAPWCADSRAGQPSGAAAGSEEVQRRVGHAFWARPGLSDTSVEFFKEPELRSRAPVYRKARFTVLAALAIRPFPEPEPVYRVRFDGGDEAYIAVQAFDALLFHEPSPNQTLTTGFTPPLGEGVHVYLFKRSAIFAEDPDAIWERIRNDGPRSFQPAAPR